MSAKSLPFPKSLAESPTYDELYSGEWEHPNYAIGT